MTDRLTALRGLLVKVEADRQTQEARARAEAAEAKLSKCEALLELIQEEWHGAVYGDLENGVASLNEAAAKDFHRRYPLVSNFGATINRIIDGDKDD